MPAPGAQTNWETSGNNWNAAKAAGQSNSIDGFFAGLWNAARGVFSEYVDLERFEIVTGYQMREVSAREREAAAREREIDLLETQLNQPSRFDANSLLPIVAVGGLALAGYALVKRL